MTNKLHSPAAGRAWADALRLATQHKDIAIVQVTAASDVAFATHPAILRHNAAILAGARPANCPVAEWAGDVPVATEIKVAGKTAQLEIKAALHRAIAAILDVYEWELLPAETALAADRSARLADPKLVIFGA